MKATIFALLALLFTIAFSQRQVNTLNAAWKFSSEVHSERTVNIPHTWNNEDAFRDGKEYFRGKGTYNKTIFAPEEWKDKKIFLKFEGK